MAIPKGGFFTDKVEQGRYGPIFPKTPACYGFSILAKVIPGREERFYEYARNMKIEVRRVFEDNFRVYGARKSGVSCDEKALRLPAAPSSG